MAVIDLGGVRGPKGVQGVVGEQGPKGQTGVRGRTVNIVAGLHNVEDLPNFDDVESNTGYLVDDGDGRYDLYLKGKGTTWTINENWQGPKGTTGDQGPTGPAGDQGDKGAQGEQGPQGLQGLTGPKGEPGIKGIKGQKGLKAKPTFKIDENGHVIMEYDDSLTPPHAPVVDISSAAVVTSGDGTTNIATIKMTSIQGTPFDNTTLNTKNPDRARLVDSAGTHAVTLSQAVQEDGSVVITLDPQVALKTPTTITFDKGFLISETTAIASKTSVEVEFEEIQTEAAPELTIDYDTMYCMHQDGKTELYFIGYSDAMPAGLTASGKVVNTTTGQSANITSCGNMYIDYPNNKYKCKFWAELDSDITISQEFMNINLVDCVFGSAFNSDMSGTVAFAPISKDNIEIRSGGAKVLIKMSSNSATVSSPTWVHTSVDLHSSEIQSYLTNTEGDAFKYIKLGEEYGTYECLYTYGANSQDVKFNFSEVAIETEISWKNRETTSFTTKGSVTWPITIEATMALDY